MAKEPTKPPISFLAFFLIWAECQRWEVPDIHIRACQWLEHRGDLAVLRCFRGFGKSTILGVYNAWRYYCDPTYRILHQGDQDGTAYKTSRDTRAVLLRHPLTAELARRIRGEVSFWWMPGNPDLRNPSMQAAGILSNITSSRADEVQNDDVEVPKNIQTPEAREKLRYRLGEQTHILVPGGRRLFIGTPHTHDSIYDEQEKMGADCLTIRMFEHEHRIEHATCESYRVPFRPELVFLSIHRTARLLEEGVDYRYERGNLVFASPPGGLIDCYAGHAWPERFTREEMLKRRRATKTINEWDSQYQLHSKPITEMRLAPEKIIPYAVEPMLVFANRSAAMYLGKVRLAGMSMRWDPSSGKLHSDVSSVALVLQDEAGRRYWHRAEALTGEIAEYAADGRTIVGGQVWQLCNMIQQFSVPRVVIETNGIGGFAPAVLKACLKQRGLLCGVAEETAVANKGKRILEAFEDIMSAGMLWAHVSVLEGPVWDQMKDFNPAVKDQPDDYLDSAAGAITDQPERIRAVGPQMSGKPNGMARHDWRPSTGVHEVTLDL